LEPIICRAFLEPISCRDLLLKMADNNLRRNFRVVCTFREIGTNKLPGAIGTIKLPERQINGSSYTTYRDTTFNRRVPYCAWDNLKDEQVFFAGSTDRNKSRRRRATRVPRDLGHLRFASSRDC
jgi:hypothetical protein